MKEFVTAVQEHDTQGEEDGAVTFLHNGREVKFYKPSDGQQAIMLSMGGRDMSTRAVGTFIQLFIECGDDDTQRYFQDLLLTRGSGFDINSEGGIFDIWEYLVEEWSGKASKQPSDYLPPRQVTGAKSTGTTPVKASTSSRSRSRVS